MFTSVIRQGGGVSLVVRTEPIGKLEEIEAVVESVEEKLGFSGRLQYELGLKPTNVKVKGPMGVFHEWIALSATASQEAVPQGSVLERYLTHMEICIPAIKKAVTVKQAFQMLVGKKFRFQRMKLGRDFEGNPAREYLVPVAAL